MKPLKSDFPTFVQFSLNIEDRLINPHIEDAYKFDVRPQMESLAVDIYNYDASVLPLTKPELKAFFDSYVLEWWIRLAYKRFIAVHGFNVTQFGFTQTKDPGGTFDQLESKERAVMLKQITSDASVCFNYALQQTWTFDTIVYRKPGGCGPRVSNFGINALE
jgi:hypothetical protein